MTPRESSQRLGFAASKETQEIYYRAPLSQRIKSRNGTRRLARRPAIVGGDILRARPGQNQASQLARPAPSPPCYNGKLDGLADCHHRLSRSSARPTRRPARPIIFRDLSPRVFPREGSGRVPGLLRAHLLRRPLQRRGHPGAAAGAARGPVRRPGRGRGGRPGQHLGHAVVPPPAGGERHCRERGEVAGPRHGGGARRGRRLLPPGGGRGGGRPGCREKRGEFFFESERGF